MKVTFIIPTYNRKNFLKKILNNISSQVLPDSIQTEAVIIVDGSTDGTLEMLRDEFSQYKLIQSPGNWWWTKCINEGFKAAIKSNADFVLILNDDTQIYPDFLGTLLTDYKSLPPGSILGSASISLEPKDLIDFAGTKNQKRWNLKASPYVKGLIPLFKDFKGVHPTYTMNGRGTLIPTFLFSEIGFFDEKLVQYGSDDEFVMRARKANIPAYISWNARVYNNLMMTSDGATFKKGNFLNFLKSFFNNYSINSVKKTSYLYWKYGIKILTPLYVLYVFAGTFKSYLFKYRNI